MYAYPLDSIVTYAEDGTPQFDRAVDSSQLRELYSNLMTNGVLLKDSTNLQVTANNNMEIVVSPGLCNIQGAIKKFGEDTTITVASANATMNRIDTIVARLDLNSDYRDIGLFIIQGTPASVPTRPELTRNTSVYEIALADITIKANATSITQANISDTRLDTNRCGIISAIAEFDTTELYNQIQTDLKEFQESNELDFEQWFQIMKDQLSEDAAGNIQVQLDDHTEKSVPSENGAHGFRYFEGKLQAHIYDEESMTLKWVTVPGSGIAYDGDKSVQGAIDEVSRTLGYTVSKNLLCLDNAKGETGAETVTRNGDSLTITATISLNTYLCAFGTHKLKKGTYILSCKSTNYISNGSKCGWRIYSDGVWGEIAYSDTYEFTLDSDMDINIAYYLSVNNDVSVGTSVTLTELMLRTASEDNTYEPYVADLKSLSVKTYITEQKAFEITAGNLAEGLFDLPTEIGINEVLGVTILTDGSIYILSNIRSVNKNRIHVNFRNLWSGTIGMYAKLLIMYR
jgi:hypothetical protein